MRRVKQRLKPWYFGGRRLLARTLFAYGPSELDAALQSLGAARRQTMLLHSGFPPASGFTGSPRDAIECCLKLLGPDGNMAMLSIPYKGSSERYLAQDPVFDVARTPSAMGIMSEVFRRRPDVVRSASPLHPLLAWGPLAPWLISDHDALQFSCGPGSPFERLLGVDAIFVFLDAPFSSLTFMHYIEHAHRDAIPVPLYEETVALVRVVDHTGRERRVRQRYFAAPARARRVFAEIQQRLTSEGTLRARRVGRSHLLAVRATDIVACANRVVAEGKGLYR